MLPHELLLGVAVAAVLGLIGALLVNWRGVAGGGAAITTLGTLGISWAVSFGYHLPPFLDANTWLPLLALMGAVIYSFMAAVPGPRLQLRLALSAGLTSALGCFLILHQLIHLSISSYAIPIALGSGLITGGISWCWERASQSLPPLYAQVVVLAGMVGLFGTMMAGGSLAYGFRVAVLCAALASPLILAFWKLPTLGVAGASASAGSWLVVLAYALIDYPRSPAVILLPCAGMIALSGMAGWVMLLPVLRKRPHLALFLALLLASVLAILAIVWMVLIGQPHEKLGADEE